MTKSAVLLLLAASCLLALVSGSVVDEVEIIDVDEVDSNIRQKAKEPNTIKIE